jgi:hypothetical protein
MNGLPSPEDITVRVLIWLGAPAVIVTIYTSVFAFLGWVSLGKSGARGVSTAAARIRQTAVDWSSERQRATMKFIAASTAFVAVVYSLTQLAGVTYEKIGRHLSIAEGLTFNAGYLVSELLGYQHWTRLSAWTVLAALVSIFLLNVAGLFRAPTLSGFVTVIWAIVLVPGAFAALLVALAGASVLILGLTHQDNYQPSMAVLYLLWVVCLLSLPLLGRKIVSEIDRMFPSITVR